MPARPWVLVIVCWTLLSILNPLGNSPLSAAAEAMLIISTVSPVFWVGSLGMSPARLDRLLVGIFLVCAAGTLVGVLQFYYPGRFDPPYIPYLETNTENAQALFYETPDGRRVMRPCGLTDLPGSAASAGSLSFLMGLGLSLRRNVRWWVRPVYLGMAVAGLAIIYFSQVRATMATTLGAAGLMVGLLFIGKQKARAIVLLVAGAVIFVAALGWAMRSGGSVVVDRFLTLFKGGDTASVYYENRGVCRKSPDQLPADLSPGRRAGALGAAVPLLRPAPAAQGRGRAALVRGPDLRLGRRRRRGPADRLPRRPGGRHVRLGADHPDDARPEPGPAGGDHHVGRGGPGRARPGRAGVQLRGGRVLLGHLRRPARGRPARAVRPPPRPVGRPRRVPAPGGPLPGSMPMPGPPIGPRRR